MIFFERTGRPWQYEGQTGYLTSVILKDALMIRNVRNKREFANIMQEESQWWLLHWRFGHPGTARMKKIVKRLGVKLEHEETCKTCIRAKSAKKLK